MRLHRFVLIVSMLTATPLTRAATIEVPKHHPTIAHAISACFPGDTILVSKGTYPPFSLSGKSDVTIRGKGKVEIDATGQLFGVSLYQAHSAHLKNLRVEGSTMAGIFVESSDAVIVEKCRVSDATGDGIGVAFGSEVALLDNRVRDVEDIGLLVAASPVALVRGNRVQRALIGISLHETTGTVSENRIEDSEFTGIALDPSPAATLVLDNRVLGGGTGLWHFGSSSHTTIAGNRFVKPAYVGLVIDAPGNAVLENTVKKSGLVGIWVTAPEGLYSGNRVRKSAADGLHVESIGGTYLENSVRKSGQYDLLSSVGLAKNSWIENDFGSSSP